MLDLLWRHQAKEFLGDILFIISNHPDLEPIARQFGADFYHLPITRANQSESEEK